MRAPTESARNFHVGVLACLAAALSFAIAALLVKVCAESFSTVFILWSRALLQTAILGVTFAVLRESPWGPSELRGWLSLRGLLGVGAVVGYFIGIIMLPLADAISIYSTKPVIAALVASRLLGERMSRSHAAAGVLSVCGCVLVAYSGEHGDVGASLEGSSRLVGAWITVISAGLAAGSSVLTRLVMSQSGIRPEIPTWYFSIADVVVLLAATPVLSGTRFSARPPEWSLGHAIALFGVGLFSFLGQQFMSMGYRHVRSALGTLLVQTETVHAFALQAVVYGHVGLQSAAGAALICAATGSLAALEMRGDKPIQAEAELRGDCGPVVADKIPRFSHFEDEAGDEFNEDWT